MNLQKSIRRILREESNYTNTNVNIGDIYEEEDQEEITEKWSEKYKKSINCNNPKGFSQKAHCAGKHKKNEIDEYARTLKNARQQGVGLRFPKSAIKSNPSRFRPYNRKGVNESDLETNQNDKRIVCEKCGWSWDLSDGGDDPYTCHKCGNENHKEMDLQESIRRILREEFNQLPKYLYHLTSDENYKNILMEGVLNPKYSKQSKRKKGIYLSDDISVAENYRFFYEPNEKVVLLKIKTSSLNEDSFYPDDYELQDFLDDGGWGVDEDIEYSRWYDVPWQLSLKWVNQIQYLEPIPISEIKKI